MTSEQEKLVQGMERDMHVYAKDQTRGDDSDLYQSHYQSAVVIFLLMKIAELQEDINYLLKIKK